MTKMTQKQLMDILRNHITKYEKEWDAALKEGNQRQADMQDGRVHEAQDLLWMLESVVLVRED